MDTSLLVALIGLGTGVCGLLTALVGLASKVVELLAAGRKRE